MIRPFLDRINSFVPHVSIDCVVFGYHNKELHVLLLKYFNIDIWAIPGGFLSKDTEMEDVVNQVLKDRTGLSNIFLEQFHTFSSPNRGWHCNEISKTAYQQVMKGWSEQESIIIEKWLTQRFVTTAFIALLNSSDVKPTPDHTSEICTWIPVSKLPPLILDHAEIIKKALEHLRVKLRHLPIVHSLLPEKFTLLELQILYEKLSGKTMNRGNFQRKMMKLDILIRHNKLMTGAQNKAPYLYSINHKVYEKLLKDGIDFI